MTNKPIPATPALPDVAEGMRFTDAVIAAENAKSFMIYQTNKTWQHRGTLTEFSDDERATNDWLPVAGTGKWPECQRYESATGEIFNVRFVNKPENKIVYTRSDVDLNGVFTVTLDEWLANLGEQRGDTPFTEAQIYDILEHLGVAGVGPQGITKAVWNHGKVTDVVPAKWVMEFVAELSRLSSPIFKSFSHMIGEILDRIDMAPNDDPIPYIREYVDGLRKSHLTDLRKD